MTHTSLVLCLGEQAAPPHRGSVLVKESGRGPQWHAEDLHRDSMMSGRHQDLPLEQVGVLGLQRLCEQRCQAACLHSCPRLVRP